MLGCSRMEKEKEGEKEKEKGRGDGGRIKGHGRQWGLCGHLSGRDGKAVEPREDGEQKMSKGTSV